MAWLTPSEAAQCGERTRSNWLTRVKEGAALGREDEGGCLRVWIPQSDDADGEGGRWFHILEGGAGAASKAGRKDRIEAVIAALGVELAALVDARGDAQNGQPSGGKGVTTDEVKAIVEGGIAGASAEVTDLTGTGDHFKIVVKAGAFVGKSRIEQHKMVHKPLMPFLLDRGIHAIDLKTLLP